MNGTINRKVFVLPALIISQIALSPETPFNGVSSISSLVYLIDISSWPFVFLTKSNKHPGIKSIIIMVCSVRHTVFLFLSVQRTAVFIDTPPRRCQFRLLYWFRFQVLLRSCWGEKVACNYVGETLNTLATSAAAAGTNERVHRAMERHSSRFLPRSKALVRLPGRRLPTVGGWSAAMKTHETMEVIIMSLVRPSALQCERGVWSERALTAVLHPSPSRPPDPALQNLLINTRVIQIPVRTNTCAS